MSTLEYYGTNSTMNSKGLSDYEKVRDFTIQAGQHVTDVPKALSESEVRFLLRMCLSELQELALSVTDSVDASVAMLNDCMKTIDKSAHTKLHTEDEIIAAQADAVVDAWYYSCNAFAKKSVDVSQIFNVVHDANMAKRDPKTKKFIKREDGKIIKPEGWKEPDVVAEVARQRAVLTRQVQKRRFNDIISKGIPERWGYDTLRQCSGLAFECVINMGMEIPTVECEVDEALNKGMITFVWNGRIKVYVYTSGNTAVFDIINQKVLDNGFTYSGAINVVRQFLETYAQSQESAAKDKDEVDGDGDNALQKPSLVEVRDMHSSIKIQDMK